MIAGIRFERKTSRKVICESTAKFIGKLEPSGKWPRGENRSCKYFFPVTVHTPVYGWFIHPSTSFPKLIACCSCHCAIRRQRLALTVPIQNGAFLSLPVKSFPSFSLAYFFTTMSNIKLLMPQFFACCVSAVSSNHCTEHASKQWNAIFYRRIVYDERSFRRNANKNCAMFIYFLAD